VIVRLMGEGQWEIDEDCGRQLNELDDEAIAALERQDEPALDQALERMAELVRREGRRLPDEDLHTSHVVIPPSDLSLEEVRELFAEDQGLIPDLPV
jgi:CBS domain-containing protein